MKRIFLIVLCLFGSNYLYGMETDHLRHTTSNTTNIKVSLCPCKKTRSTSRNGLKNHIQRKHAKFDKLKKIMIFTCPDEKCQQVTFECDDDLIAHFAHQHKIPQSYLFHKDEYEDYNLTKSKKRKSNVTITFTCPCETTLNNNYLSTMQEHSELAHYDNNLGLYPCIIPQCRRALKTAEDFVYHLADDHKEFNISGDFISNIINYDEIISPLKKARKLQNEPSAANDQQTRETIVNAPITEVITQDNLTNREIDSYNNQKDTTSTNQESDFEENESDIELALNTVLREMAHDDSHTPFRDENFTQETLNDIDIPNLPASHQENNSEIEIDFTVPNQEEFSTELINEMEIPDSTTQPTQENNKTTDISIVNISDQEQTNSDELFRDVPSNIDNNIVCLSSAPHISEMQPSENQIIEEVTNQDNNLNVASPYSKDTAPSRYIYCCLCKKVKTKLVRQLRKHLKDWHYDKNSAQFFCPEKDCNFLSSSADNIIDHLHDQHKKFKRQGNYLLNYEEYYQQVNNPQLRKKIKQTIVEKIKSLTTIKKTLSTLDTEEKFLKQAEYLIINYKKLLQSNRYICWHNTIILALVDTYCDVANYLFTHHKYQEAMEFSNKIREECSLLGYDKYPHVEKLLRSLDLTLLPSNNSLVASTNINVIAHETSSLSSEDLEKFLDSLLT